MNYKNLEQRMAQGYMDMFPLFIPDDDAPVSAQEQERFYNIMKNLYIISFNEPLLFVTTLHEDDAYPSRFKKSYGKPELIRNMRKYTKAVDDLVKKMFLLGQGGDVALNKRQKAILLRLEIADSGNLPAAWVWMSTRDEASLQAFSRCLFDKRYCYSSDIYAHLFGETAFTELESRLLANGYRQFDVYNVTASDCKLSLTIANPKWGEGSPNGGFEYKVKHTGISALYDDYVATPQTLGLCIPNGMKPYLKEFDFMDSDLQEFVVQRTKKCDGCRYCIQTDKTGSRPMAYISVKHEDREYKLCTYFPGYSYCWQNIDDGVVEKLIKMLSFMDKFAPEMNADR